MEEAIFLRVRDYLTDNVGELTAPGTPVPDQRTGLWRVPVLSRTSKGVLPIGEILADAEGHVLSAPSKEQMLAVRNAQTARLPFLVFGDKDELESKGVRVVSV